VRSSSLGSETGLVHHSCVPAVEVGEIAQSTPEWNVDCRSAHYIMPGWVVVTGLASGLGALLILLGGFIMAVAYGFVSQCSSRFPYSNCWDPFLGGGYGFGAIGFYIGATVAIFGIATLPSGTVVRQLGKMRDTSPDTKC